MVSMSFAGCNGMLLPSASTLECTASVAVRLPPGPFADHHTAQPPAGAPVHMQTPTLPGELPGSTLPGEAPGPAGHLQNGAQVPPSVSTNSQDEEALLKSAAEIRREWSLLSKACSRPCEEPARATDHWGHVLNEAMWMANDFGQERLWKLATCRKIAAEAAAYGSTWWERLRETNHIYGSSVGAGEPTVRQQAKEYYQKENAAVAAEERIESGKAVGPSGGDHMGRQNGELTCTSTWIMYPAPEYLILQVQSGLGHLLEKALIADLQVKQEYEADAEGVRRNLAEAARIRNGATPGAHTMEVDVEEDDMGMYNKRRKATRRPREYVYDDTELPAATGRDRRAGASRKMASVVPSRPNSTENLRTLDSSHLIIEGSRRPIKKPRRIRDDDYDEDEFEPRNLNNRGRREPLKRPAVAAPKAEPKRLKTQPSKSVDRLGSLPPQARLAGGRASNMPSGREEWPLEREQLLTATVHEFGSNWRLVSDVMNCSLHLHGIHLSDTACKARFKDIVAQQQQQQAGPVGGPGGGQVSVDPMLVSATIINKQDARALLCDCLPAPYKDIQHAAHILTAIATKHKLMKACF
eukprot:jgi/Botrbrau1/17276/Bobra.0015s0034.2